MACGRSVSKLSGTAGFGQKVQKAELDYLIHSQAASALLAENYVALPLDFGEH